MQTKDNEEIKFSIIVPYHNTKEEYFGKCLDSLANQDYSNYEVIIINDSTSNEYDNILEPYKKLNNFVIKRELAQGVSASRNQGVQLSTGDYILFVDADDWLMPNTCKILAQIVANNNLPQVIIGRCFLHRDSDIQQNECKQDSGIVTDKQLLIDSIFLNYNNKYTYVDTPWAKAFNKKFLQDNNIKFKQTLSNGEDGVFNYEAYTKANSIYFTREIIYNYRFNPYSVCASYTDDLDKKFATLYDEYKKAIDTLATQKDRDLNNLNYLAIRNLCRCLRKLLNKCPNYKSFKARLKSILDMPEYSTPLRDIKLSDLNCGKRYVTALCRLKIYYPLYRMSKKGFKIR